MTTTNIFYYADNEVLCMNKAITVHSKPEITYDHGRELGCIR
jgi:hypothetical protein